MNHRQPESTPTHSGRMASELGNSDATIRASDTAHGCQGSVVDHLPRIQMWARRQQGQRWKSTSPRHQCRRSTESRRRKAHGVESATARRSSAGARSSARTSSRPAAVVGNGFVALGTIVPAFRSHGVNPQQDTSGTRFAVCLRSTSLGMRQGASGSRERLL